MKMIKNILSQTGRSIIDLVNFSGYTILVFASSVYYMKHAFRSRREIARQMFNAGVRTFAVISIVAMFTGMILALQGGVELAEFHMQDSIGNLVIATLSREMAPFTAAIILIAAVGSAMAAEVGTMKVSEEIDALEIMSISPIRFLVMPRVVALTLVMPIATIYTNVLGCIGGAIVARSHLNISYDVFYMHVLDSLHFKSVYVGLLKSVVFGMAISSICCAQGLRAENGALGVGKATRDSVVKSFLVILITGYFITEFFFRHGL